MELNDLLISYSRLSKDDPERDERQSLTQHTITSMKRTAFSIPVSMGRHFQPIPPITFYALWRTLTKMATSKARLICSQKGLSNRNAELPV